MAKVIVIEDNFAYSEYFANYWKEVVFRQEIILLFF